MQNKSNEQTKAVKAIPDGFHSITPFIVVNRAAMLIDFLSKAFDAQVTYIMKDEDVNKITHATLKIGDSTIMIADATEKLSPMPCMLYLYVDDVDAVYRKALDAKGISLREPIDEFYGNRSASIKDAWDNHWWIATHIEDVSEEELKVRKENFSHQNVN